MAYLKWLENGYLKKQSGKYYLLLIAFSIAGFIFSRSSLSQRFPFTFALVGIFVVVVYILAYFKYFKKILHFEKGIDGEWAVAKVLCDLPESHFGFHDVRVPGMWGNIDFVVVTPTHVFALEVKNTLWYSTKSHVKQAKQGAMFLNRWLRQQIGHDIFVNPVVVFSHSKNKWRHTGIHDRAGVVRLDGLNAFVLDKSGRSYDTGLMIPVVQALKRFTPVHKVVCD
ncbi:MAG: nuclease-related domain-containing protein [Patescibacteria group bacterium]|nr:MAG: nuclease-related domain-containing protein [Patescibacteria group bacterium]